MKRALAIALAFIAAAGARAETVKPDAELGYQFGYRFQDPGVTYNRPYALVGAKSDLLTLDTSSLSANASVRGWVDTRNPNEVDVRAANLVWTQDKLNLTLGFQQIAWGETFGVYIADLVNPHDLRDPFFNDLSWTRLSTFTLNSQVFLDKLSFQFIATPVPRTNQYPTTLGGVPVLMPRDFAISDAGKDAEAGLKTGYLFESGLDVNLFYLWHWNRNPVFNLTAQGSQPALVPVVERVHTFGLTFSQSVGHWVFRGDNVFHLQTPLQTSLTQPVFHGNLFQSILGSDYSTEDDWSFGLQYHLDWWNQDRRQWASARIGKKLFRDRLEPELMVFQGLGNKDLWIQPKLTWNVSSHVSAAVQGSLLQQTSWGDPGYFAVFPNQSRLLTWFSYRF